MLGDRCANACAEGSECSSGLCISSVVGGDCVESCGGDLYCHESKCLSGAENDGCDADSSCESGLLCERGVCQRLEKGAACNARCAAGFYCDAGFCQEGVAGDSCSRTDQCKAGLYCAQKKCWTGQSGDPCQDSCSAGLFCVDGFCRDGSIGSDCVTDKHCRGEFYCADKKCVAGEEGDPCRERCKSGLYCFGETCWDGSTGDKCDAAHQCATALYCAEGECFAGEKGDKCNEKCKSGLHCVSGRCQDGAVGALCELDDQCADGFRCVAGKCGCPNKGGGFKCAVWSFDRLVEDSKPYSALSTSSGQPPWYMEKPQRYCGETYGIASGADEFEARENEGKRAGLRSAITGSTYHSWGLGQTSNHREVGSRDFNLLIEQYDFKRKAFEFRVCSASSRHPTLTGKTYVEHDGYIWDFEVAANPKFEQLWENKHYKSCFKSKLKLSEGLAKQVAKDPSKCRIDIVLEVKGTRRHKRCGTDCIPLFGCDKIDQGAGAIWDLRIKDWKISLGEQVLAVKGAKRPLTSQ